MSRGGTTRRSVDALTIRRLLELHAVKNPSILDCGANDGRMWKGLAYKRTTLDRDASFKPDVVGDWNDLPSLSLPEPFYDVLTIDFPHMSDTGRSAMGGTWQRMYGLGGDDLKGRPNIHHLYPGFLEAAKAVLVPNTGVILAKIADQVHADQRHWSDLAFVEAARAAGFVVCDRALGSSISPPNQAKDQYHMPSLTFWIVLHNGKLCRGPGAPRFLTCQICDLPMRGSRRDKKTCSDTHRRALARRAARLTAVSA
jgi:hypothetical protein